MSLEEWNERYRTGDAIDAEPAQLVIDALRDVAPGRALDLACGAGRNAVWLARAGWDVVALDGASEAIRIVRAHEPRIDARVFDLEAGAPLPFADRSFDAVLVLYYLHRPLFAEVQRVVRPGGLVIAAVRTRGRFAIKPGELIRIFDRWQLLAHREEEIAELVARKP